MQQGQQGSEAQTGTRDETYDVIAVVYHALQGAENCEIYAEDASDDEELRSFFEEAQRSQQQLAELGKQMLQKLLGKESGAGGDSAFGFGRPQGSATGEASAGREPAGAGQTGGGAGSAGS